MELKPGEDPGLEGPEALQEWSPGRLEAFFEEWRLLVAAMRVVGKEWGRLHGMPEMGELGAKLDEDGQFYFDIEPNSYDNRPDWREISTGLLTEPGWGPRERERMERARLAEVERARLWREARERERRVANEREERALLERLRRKYDPV